MEKFKKWLDLIATIVTIIAGVVTIVTAILSSR